MKKTGFSLLELMIALAIVSILAVISIPAMRDQLIQSRLKSAAETFVATAQTARSEAITRQANVYINVQAGSTWCYGTKVTSSCSCSPTNTCTLGVISNSAYPSVTTSISGFSGGSIYYDNVRGLASEASSITFTIGSDLITVTLGRLGGFSLCSTGVSGYAAC